MTRLPKLHQLRYSSSRTKSTTPATHSHEQITDTHNKRQTRLHTSSALISPSTRKAEKLSSGRRSQKLTENLLLQIVSKSTNRRYAKTTPDV